MMIFKNKNQGYTLLFAVIVASLVLAVTAFIAQVSRKQFILSSTARDSTVAIYAADSGIDCALENENNLQFETVHSPITCFGNISVVSATNLTDAGGNKYGTSTFFMPVDLPVVEGSPCVRVDVGEWYDANGNMVTNIESRGYNIGWKAASKDCSNSSPRKQERALRLRYQ